MKKYFLISILLLFCSLGLLNATESIANSDDFNAALINPAALGFDNTTGFSFQHFYDKDFSTEEDQYNLFFNFDRLSYVLQHRHDDFHRLALGTDLFSNFYYGVNYDWTNKHFGKGDFAHSILYRPINGFSFGATGNDLFSDEAEGKLGAAIRPLFLKGDFWNRFTLSTDILYCDKEWSDPVIGIQTELLDGIRLAGSYDLDLETFGIDFGVSFNKLLVGTKTSFDKDNKVANGSYYINFSGNTYRSIFDKPKKNKIYDLPLNGQIKEKKQTMKIGPINISFDKGMTVSEITKKLEMLKDDDRIAGIILNQVSFTASPSMITELEDAFNDFKSTGKKVIYYSEGISNSNYFFAAAVADEIYLNPAGYIDLRGFSMSLPFFGELLDTLGIQVENFRSHPYKTAGNTFSESKITPQERESYEYILGGIYDEFLAMVEAGRGSKLHDSAETLVNEGPYFVAQTALEKGLVDGLIYQDQLDDKLNDLIGNNSVVKGVDNNFTKYDWSSESKDKIAIIYCVGNIHSGKGIDGKSIGSVTTAKAIKKAREDKTIKGIILRIDSGGGSALASEIISREVDLCSEGKNAKPVIASMSGTAASGGYYIAAKADRIIAEPTTITGSIGVVGINFNFKGLYDKIHINWSTVKKGKNADIGSTSREMSVKEKEYFTEAIKDTYDTFIDRVASGRDLSYEQVHEIAMGRVWTGKQAYDRSLVDALGGLKLAIEDMKDIAHIEKEVQLVEFKGMKNDGINLTITQNSSLGINIPSEFKELISKANFFQNLSEEKILMVIPYNPEIK